MTAGFHKRKISNGKTLGEILKSARDKMEISLEDAETGSKVRIRYLKALESGDWKSLPSLVYVRGFVLAYAKFLGIEKGEVEPLFWAEYSFINHQQQGELSYKKLFSEKKVLITPKLLGYGTLCLFLISMFGYIAYQIANFAGSPNLRLVTPSNNSIVENDSVDIKGITDNDIYLTVNNEKVPVTTEGHFTTNLKLQRGINVLKVVAVSRTKKETSEIITIEYKPKTAMTDPLANQ